MFRLSGKGIRYNDHPTALFHHERRKSTTPACRLYIIMSPKSIVSYHNSQQSNNNAEPDRRAPHMSKRTGFLGVLSYRF